MNSPSSHPLSPTDVQTAWLAILSLAIGVFGLVTAEFLPPALLTPMSRDLGVSAGTAGQSVTVTALVATFAGPAVIACTSNIDRRIVLLSMTLLLVVSSVIAAVADTISELFIARFLLGIGLGGFWAMAIAIAMRLSNPKAMGRAMALVMGGVSLATICATPIGAFISDTIGWRYAFYMSTAIGLVALIAQGAALPQLPPVQTSETNVFRTLLRMPIMRKYLCATFFIVSGHFAAFTYIRPFLEDVTGLSPSVLSAVFLLFGVTGFVGNYIGGYMAQRSAQNAIVCSVSAIAFSMIAFMLFGGHPAVGVFAVGVWGLAFGSYPVSTQTFLTRAAPAHLESASALQTATFTSAISSGAILGGLLVNLIGPTSVFYYAAMSTTFGVLLMRAISLGSEAVVRSEKQVEAPIL